MLPHELDFGVGTWAWGDRLLWDYGRDYGRDDITAVFRRYLNDGVNLFCTSSAFAEGISESILGELAAKNPTPVKIATKYVPRIWHLRRTDFMDSLKSSMLRLQLS